MKKPVYKRINVTLDDESLRKCRSLAVEKGQSVSSLIRYLVGEAHEKTMAVKRPVPNRRN
jgi:hypothetical protein